MILVYKFYILILFSYKDNKGGFLSFFSLLPILRFILKGYKSWNDLIVNDPENNSISKLYKLGKHMIVKGTYTCTCVSENVSICKSSWNNTELWSCEIHQEMYPERKVANVQGKRL